MSITTEITRLQKAKQIICNKLKDLNLINNTSSVKLDDCAEIINNIKNNGAVSVNVENDEVYTIPKGYHNGLGTVTGVSNNNIETCTVTFPDVSLGDEHIYYLDENGQWQCLIRITTNQKDVITVIKNSIIYGYSRSSGNLWTSTYVLPQTGAILLGTYPSQYGIIVTDSIEIEYADGAPQ